MDMEHIKPITMSTFLVLFCIHHHTYVVYWQAHFDANYCNIHVHKTVIGYVQYQRHRRIL